MKKLLRTLQVYCPGLLDAKFSLMRLYRNALKRPFENDFNALALFPQVEGALFLDVGANRGQSADAILMKHQRARIHLFEPNPLLCARLRRLYRGNPAIVVNNFGLGNEDTDGILHVPFYRQWMFDGLASFDRRLALDWLGNDQIFFYSERHLTVQTSTCRIRKLDDLKLAPFMIKLDVQGFELRALQGGEETLRVHEPVLLVESPGAEITTFLKELGYDHFAYRNGRFAQGETGGLNTFYMTGQKARLVERYIDPRKRAGLR